jgi:hypothetical protein
MDDIGHEIRMRQQAERLTVEFTGHELVLLIRLLGAQPVHNEPAKSAYAKVVAARDHT